MRFAPRGFPESATIGLRAAPGGGAISAMSAPMPPKRPGPGAASIALGVAGWVLHGAAVAVEFAVPYLVQAMLGAGANPDRVPFGVLYSLPSLLVLLGLCVNAAGIALAILSFRRADESRRLAVAALAVNGMPCCLAGLAVVGFALLLAAFSGGGSLVPR